MKRYATIYIIAIGWLMMLALSSVAQAQASEKAIAPAFPRAKYCTQGTLKGSYGVLLHGTVLQHPAIPLGRFAGLGIVNFDGEGNYSIYGYTNFNGFITAYGPGEAVPGESSTYTVNADCTGLLKGGQFGVDYRIAIANDGQEYQVAFIPQAGAGVRAVINGFAQRIGAKITSDDPFERMRAPEPTAGWVSGTYSLSLEGFVNSLPPLPVGPVNGVYALVGDGQGTVMVRGNNVINGFNVPVEQSSSYTVRADGFGKLTSTNYYFVLVNGGKEILVLSAYPEGVNFPPTQGGVVFGRGLKM